jgi:predicted transcriptional regulator YdeE
VTLSVACRNNSASSKIDSVQAALQQIVSWSIHTEPSREFAVKDFGSWSDPPSAEENNPLVEQQEA